MKLLANGTLRVNNGTVLRKSSKNLQIMEVFKALLSTPEVAHAVELLQSVKMKPITETALADKYEMDEDDDNNDSIHIGKFYDDNETSTEWDITKQKYTTESMALSIFDRKDGVLDESFSLEIISANCKRLKDNSELEDLDSFLPPIAYVRLEGGENRSYKPHELYILLTESLSSVTMIQALVFYKGGIQPPYSFSTTICEFHNNPREKGTKVNLF